MTTHLWSALTNGQSVNFVAGDQIVFDGGISASSVFIGLNSTSAIFTHSGKTVTFSNLSPYQLVAGTNIVFNNGSVFLFGDNTTNVSNDTLANSQTGGTGGDHLVGAGGNDTLDGGAGDDWLEGYWENDRLLGSGGNDTLEGADGNDWLDGGAGNDTLNGNSALILPPSPGGGGGTDFDTLVGGLDNDTFLVTGTEDLIVESVGEGVADVVRSSAAAFTLPVNVENLVLTGFAGISGTGNSAANVLTGNPGNNLLDGAGGDDTLGGGNGADTLIGGLGNDSLDGGAGSDLADYLAASAAVTVNLATGATSGAAGTDTLSSIEQARGSTFADTMTGSSGADVLYGDAGNDSLAGGNDNDTLDGGANADTLVGGSGNDSLVGGAAADSLVGGDGDDTYAVDTASDVVLEDSTAGGGIDTVQSAAAAYTLPANVEHLALTGVGNINGTGNSGNNTITGNSGNNTLSGAAGNDSLAGMDGNDSLAGGTGLDTLDGGVGTDTLAGGGDDDTYLVMDSSDVISEAGGAGAADRVFSSSAAYTLPANVELLILTGAAVSGTGNTGNNVITGNVIANALNGGAGNDTLEGGGGTDTLTGGTGDDTLIVSVVGVAGASGIVFVPDAVEENAGEGADTVYSTASYALPENVENLVLNGPAYWRPYTGTGNDLDNVISGVGAVRHRLFGEGGNDTLDGGDGADMLDGGAGNDTLAGGNGADYLYGGNDSDTLGGGVGIDSLAGGAGDDTLVVSVTAVADGSGIVFVPDVVTENAGEGLDTVVSSASYALPENVENLVLNGPAFWRPYTGTGNALDNAISGEGAVRHNLYGGEGNDTLDGGAGGDQLDGGGGNDVLIWDAADTLVDGGAGADTLWIPAGVNLDLGGLAGGKIHDVEVIDLDTGAGINILTLTAANVLDLSTTTNTLTIEGATGDVVNGSGWSDAGASGGYRTWTQASATLLVDDTITQNLA